MSELLLELYSEEIPPRLQINARNQLKDIIETILNEKEIKFKECLEFSSPTRLTIYLNGLPEKIKIQSKDIKGPKVGVPENVVKSFVNSRNILEKYLYKKKTEKGEFYFAKTLEDEILTKNFTFLQLKRNLLVQHQPHMLQNFVCLEKRGKVHKQKLVCLPLLFDKI